jgi:transposase
MHKMLTLEERRILIKRHRHERDGKVRDRIKAVLAYDDGYSYTEIAKILLLDDKTVARHIDDYLQEKKLTLASGGSDSKLTANETRELCDHLKEVTYLYVRDICDYVRSCYGKKYSISGMTKWLQTQGFRYKKPHAVPAKADREQQQAFVDYYHQLKAKAGAKEPIYFADSVHPQHQTQLVYGWIFKGERKEIATTGRQYRLNIIGGICLNGHRFVYQPTDKVDANSIALFLIKLRKLNPGKYVIHVIWDNAGYHRDRSIKEFAAGLAIKLHYLPPYSPNLNPIERLWKILHEQVTYNKYYRTFAEFTAATSYFLNTIGRKKTILRRRITDNFQILHSPIPAF